MPLFSGELRLRHYDDSLVFWFPTTLQAVRDDEEVSRDCTYSRHPEGFRGKLAAVKTLALKFRKPD